MGGGTIDPGLAGYTSDRDGAASISVPAARKHVVI